MNIFKKLGDYFVFLEVFQNMNIRICRCTKTKFLEKVKERALSRSINIYQKRKKFKQKV